jgi:hypothetical protein
MRPMITRRDLLTSAGQTCLAAGSAPLASFIMDSTLTAPGDSGVNRCINVVNFIRGVEPRSPIDLLLPVQKQMELALKHNLPTTWLLQFDALVSGPFVEYLKGHLAPSHEIGIWFEMNEKHCKAAEVEWRGRPGLEWDSQPPVAFTIGYTEAERVKLADAFMREFKRVWGKYPTSVASWNLDSITMRHLTEKYGIDAFAVCRDQIATDGFTIWGAPIAGYYPSKVNCWSPAVNRKNQIDAPVFRMLGQDPVYYYDTRLKLPNGKVVRQPDTMEPVWTAGRSPKFIKEFLTMISESPTLQFAYAQLGQENNFGWPEMEQAYPLQMVALAALRDAGSVQVETMGASGRRFKRAYKTTPAQAQVMLSDPFGNTESPEGSVWYQSRFYRADLHLKGDLPYLRDLTVYSDRNPQPFLNKATREHDVEQRMPAVMDGFHWSKSPGSLTEVGAGVFFQVGGERLRLSGRPEVKEEGQTLLVTLPVQGGGVLHMRFEEREIVFRLTSAAKSPLVLSFEWDPAKAALVEVGSDRASYRWQGFDYSVGIGGGQATSTPGGFTVTANKRDIALEMAQSG